MQLLFEVDKKDYDLSGPAFVRPSARAVILRQGKLAVIYSRKHKYCKIPGGGIEPGETPHQAMIREVREEAGLTVLPDSVREFGYVRHIRKGRHESVFIQDNYYYFCDVLEETRPALYTPSELEADFEPLFLPVPDAARINAQYLEKNPDDTMIEREWKVMRLLLDEQPAL